MTYEEALAFWYGRVNFEMRSPGPSDLKLDRMRALLEVLGDPQTSYPIIHIAGTKGKGSTSAMIASILRQAGYRVGLFTSPHLAHVEERIQVDGVPISRSDLAALMSVVADAMRRLDAEHGGVTFFELATAVGFLYFQQTRTDFAVIEVGLGGRFDSTNVCQPLLSIITNISFDHTQQLGNTLAKIAFEKAGIVKPGLPALSGVRSPEARAVIVDVCRERQAPLREIDVDFHYQHLPASVGGHADRSTAVQVSTWRRSWPALEIGLMGEHQAANAALAIAASELLGEHGVAIAEEHVAAGLKQVSWPARMEVARRRPIVVLDCAHNVASVEATLQTLLTSFRLPAGARRLLIFAASRDKDVAGMLAMLAPHFAHIYLTTFGNNPRCCTPEELAELMPEQAAFSLQRNAHHAWQDALAAAAPDDLICITGSVFLAGELQQVVRD